MDSDVMSGMLLCPVCGGHGIVDVWNKVTCPEDMPHGSWTLPNNPTISDVIKLVLEREAVMRSYVLDLGFCLDLHKREDHADR